MDINKLHKALDELMISQEEKAQKMKRPINNYPPENYYPNPNNISNKNVSYYVNTINPNTLCSDEYYNDEYYNNGYSSSNSYSNSNINVTSNSDYYYNKISSHNSSTSSLGSRDKNMRNIEQLKIKTHTRTQSNSSDQFRFNHERRTSQDTMSSSLFSPESSALSQSSASINDPMTASIISDISSVTLQTLSCDLASGFLNRVTSSAGFIKNTKRYYFVLDSEGLYYFKTNDPFARAKGFIKFDSRTKIKDIKENSSAKDKSSKIIELEVYKDNKSHQVVLQAEDPEDRDMWHRTLKKTIVRQKYVNEALPPLPQTPGSSQQASIPLSGGRSRSQSQSSIRNSPNQTPNLLYTQQLRLSQQKLANSYEGNPNAPLSKKSSFQNISEINMTAPNMYTLQNRRRPSLDVQMYHHGRTSSLSSLNEINRQRYSYGSTFSNQSHGSNNYN
ncbi:hypothetical protein BCR36DRAFT_26079 [Piromyces finnis]|uniref:PH domain-containing protein n=1 Tax=Piromyces finnis TaxID=1754191 RepID=A0A1Y1VDF4_9FUNG|nr:hypothetical protein BCR36DRAFT_26079 [Piromyces finnis]|eukprot:ORX53430.1 hypothetical protein BCR36DRAFT_26079 [Piromyces finnis]